MRIRRGAGNDFTEEDGESDAIEMGVFGFGIFGLIYAQAGESRLEDLVEWKLDSDVGETEEGWGQTGIEGEDAFVSVHLAKGVESVVVKPRGSVVSECTSGIRLGHQTGFDDPDGIRGHCRAGPTSQRGVDVGEEFVVCA